MSSRTCLNRPVLLESYIPIAGAQTSAALTITWKSEEYGRGIRLEASVLLLPPRAVRHRRSSSAGSIRAKPVLPKLPGAEPSDLRTVTASWRTRKRLSRLRSLAASCAQLQWSGGLLQMLIEELHVDDEFDVLLGDPRGLPVRRYPQAVAVAVVLRHSWRPDLLGQVATRIRRMSRDQRLPRPRVHKSRHR